MKTTYYIVPAWSDQAGQCRIVSHAGRVENAQASYRDCPEQWREAGLMNSQGRLICLDGTAFAVAEFRDCEPLMAGLQITVDEPSWEDLTPEQCERLIGFRIYHSQRGRPWKEELLRLWAAGHDTAERDGHLLRQIRDQFGPTWLTNLPEN